MLEAIPHSSFLFEPLHLTEVPEAKKAGFDWCHYLPPAAAWPSGEEYLERVFTGKVINRWTAREIRMCDAPKAKRLVIKFVRANRLLPWICSRFPIKKPILLIRHPCAVVSSQMKYGWAGHLPPVAPEYLEAFPAFKEVIERTQNDYEYLAAKWAMDQLPCLIAEQPLPWMVITYEELVLHPEETLKKIARQWDLPIDLSKAVAKLNRPTSVVSKVGISGLDGWKKSLSNEQIDNIMRVVYGFGFDFYNDSPEAEYSILHSNDLAKSIRKKGTALV
jgi:hypothetical protein